MVWEKLQQVERQDIRLTMDLGRVKSGNAIAMALALDFEQLNAFTLLPSNYVLCRMHRFTLRSVLI